jgi:hypothetical protein
MSVHAVTNHQASISLQSHVSKPAVKVAQPGSFAELFGTYSPSVGAVGKTPTSTPTTTTAATPAPAPPPFTATYEQGAYTTGPDGTQTNLNPMEMATASTAAEVAQLLGGTVVNDSMGGNFTSSAPTREIQVPGSSNEINAGLAANLFAQYGTAQGSQAWTIIDRDLGLS